MFSLSLFFTVLLAAGNYDWLAQAAIPEQPRLYDSKTTSPVSTTDWDEVFSQINLPKSCDLVHFRVVTRHGTRAPEDDLISDAEKAVAKVVKNTKTSMRLMVRADKTLSTDQIKAIMSWQNTLPDTKELLQRGKEEHAVLAVDYFALLSRGNNAAARLRLSEAKFEPSNVSRTQDSGLAFQTQWYKMASKPQHTEPITANDTRLYFHKNCPGYTTRVDKNDAANVERKAAKKTADGIAVLANVNEKLGFSKSVLDWSDVFSLYEMAAFELAAYDHSVFTPLFGDEDLAFLEYADDLEHYWVASYSSDPVTREMSCPLKNHIFETARQAYSGDPDVRGVFGFGHLEVALPVFASFGLFYESPTSFVANASRAFYYNRKFDTSEIGRFATTFAFLFYHCPLQTTTNDKLVVVIVNGKPVLLPLACPKDYACPLSVVEEAYPFATGFLEQCNLEQVCSDKSDLASYRTET